MISLALINRNLAMAERHVEGAMRHLALQREIVDSLENVGGDARVARGLLATFEHSLSLHVEDRDRLRKMKMEAEGLTLRRMLINQRTDRIERSR